MRMLVVAPHPDDEVLGCGGTLLRRKAEGASLAWIIVTEISGGAGWPAERVRQREVEIDAVAKAIGFDHVYNLRLPAARLDGVPLGDLIDKLSVAIRSFEPNEMLVPHRSDVHSDHRIVFDAVAACTKWFRYPSVRRVLAYETLSETDLALGSGDGFHPNVFVDISRFAERKLQLLAIYQSELGVFPFPRSPEALSALASIRGAASGFSAAEAFELLRERQQDPWGGA
jgi:N-acetylglucosamine malate deacetylase 1